MSQIPKSMACMGTVAKLTIKDLSDFVDLADGKLVAALVCQV